MPSLPTDPDLLKAMLLAERARSERLEQIIKAMQRHRFGPRAESLPVDQLLLGLEEAKSLPYASSLCGACGEVCPVKIPLPQRLVTQRTRTVGCASELVKSPSLPAPAAASTMLVRM